MRMQISFPPLVDGASVLGSSVGFLLRSASVRSEGCATRRVSSTDGLLSLLGCFVRASGRVYALASFFCMSVRSSKFVKISKQREMHP